MKKIFLLPIILLSFSLFAQKTEKANSINITTKNKTSIRIDNTKKAPLYMVNEKIVSKKAVNKINPNNIKSINVVKGDKAREVYGVRGENGVVIITMKTKKEIFEDKNKKKIYN